MSSPSRVAHDSEGPAYLRKRTDGCTLAVRVQPGVKRTCIAGIYGGHDQAQLKIALKAPAVEGRANEALIAFCAEIFALPKSSITIVAGELSRNKVTLLKGAVYEKVSDTVLRLLQDL